MRIRRSRLGLLLTPDRPRACALSSAATIARNIESVQGQTASILAEQERDLMKAFRSRLYTLQGDLEAQRNRADKGASEYIERIRNLEKNLEFQKEQNDKLERAASGYQTEYQRLKNQFAEMSGDREFMLKQLLGSRKETARLQADLASTHDEIATLKAEIDEMRNQASNDRMTRMEMAGRTAPPSSSRVNTAPSRSSGGVMSDEELLRVADGIALGTEPLLSASASSAFTGSGAASSSSIAAAAAVTEARYREIIARLKRLLDGERRALKTTRATLAAEMTATSDAERLLRRAIDDARTQLDRKRGVLQAAAMGETGRSRSPARAQPAHYHLPSNLRLAASQSDVHQTPPADADHGAGDAAYDHLSMLSRAEREALLTGILSQQAVLDHLPRAVFHAKRGKGNG